MSYRKSICVHDAVVIAYIAAILLALPMLQRWLPLPKLMALFASRR